MGARETPSGGGPRLADRLIERFPPRRFDRGDVVLHGLVPGAPAPKREPALGLVVAGLVRVSWMRGYGAPGSRASAVVAGDGRWIGAEAFRTGENLFLYEALVPTTAALVPLDWIRSKASPAVLFDALHSVSLDWCRRISGPGVSRETDYRRTLVLFHDLRRLHAAPAIELRQKQVAEMVGVRRKELLPILQRLERAGLVRLGFGEVSVGALEDLREALRHRRVAADDPFRDPSAPDRA